MASLTIEELALAERVGLPADVCLLLKDAAGGAYELRQAIGYDDDGDGDGGYEERQLDGVYVPMSKDDARQRVAELQGEMLRLGCRCFHGDLPEDDAAFDRRTRLDALVVLATTDDRAMARAGGTSPGNYDMDNRDVIAQLERWTADGGQLTVIGAGSDWLELAVANVPGGDVCAFAVALFEFCPDLVHQGSGLFQEDEDPELFEAARAVCPGDIPALRDLLRRKPSASAKLGMSLDEQYDDVEMGVKLIAQSLAEDGVVGLWWD